MKLMVLLLINFLGVACGKQKVETDKHKVFSICEYYDNIGNSARREECVICFQDAYGSQETPSDEKLKSCIKSLPDRFKKIAETEKPVAPFIGEILKWREEQRVVFAENHKDVLSFKEIEVVSQIGASMFMAQAMVLDMPFKQVEVAIKPVYKCFEPGMDLSQFDNEVMNEQDIENEINKDEDKMLKKGSAIVKRQATEEEVSIRTRVKNMYKRIYRYYVCAINRIGEDKEASSIVKDYLMNDYEGIVPAKVARDACKW